MYHDIVETVQLVGISDLFFGSRKLGIFQIPRAAILGVAGEERKDLGRRKLGVALLQSALCQEIKAAGRLVMESVENLPRNREVAQ